MIFLRPGVKADTVVESLTNAAMTAGNLLSGQSPVDRLNRYREWANNQLKALAPMLTPSSLDDLIATRRYWTLQSLDPAAYGAGGPLASLVDLEITERAQALEDAAKDVSNQESLWVKHHYGATIGERAHATVLDTNVLLRHARELADIDWSAKLNIFPHYTIALGIPMTVVEELDRLKDSNGVMYPRGEKTAVRTLARAALRRLEELFPQQWTTAPIQQSVFGNNIIKPEVYAVLMVQPLDRPKLIDSDADIIDQTIALQAYAQAVALASYDNNMIFRARSLGLTAFKPEDDLAE